MPDETQSGPGPAPAGDAPWYKQAEQFGIGLAELVATGIGKPQMRLKVPTEKEQETVDIGREITFTEEYDSATSEIVFTAQAAGS